MAFTKIQYQFSMIVLRDVLINSAN